jgi:hypothetical protein
VRSDNSLQALGESLCGELIEPPWGDVDHATHAFGLATPSGLRIAWAGKTRHSAIGKLLGPK